jgi:hypothetical protein
MKASISQPANHLTTRSKVPECYEMPRFIIAYTTTCHLSLYWEKLIQPTHSHHRLNLPRELFFFFWFSNQNSLCIPLLFHMCYMRRPYHPPWFYHPCDVWLGVKIMKLRIMQFYTLLATFSSAGPDSSPPPCSQTCPSLNVRDQV